MRDMQLGNLDEVEGGWSDLSEVVDKSEGLGTYPVGHLFGLVKELGEIIDSSAFDALYDKLAATMGKRGSEGDEGMAYVRRANQKMRLEKPYEAIQWFGRAEELMIKREYRKELVMTLLGVSQAYDRVGLLWAARNKALAASDLALGVLKEQGQLIPAAMIALKWLTWIELRLGRIPHSLEAIDFADLVASHLELSEDQLEAYVEERQMQEWVLGIHFLNIPLQELPNVTRLPDSLHRLGLDYARVALLFALGHEQVLQKEGFFEDVEVEEAVQTFFEQWQDQPAAEDIPPQPMLVDGETSTLKSTIFGSEIIVETPHNEISFGIAESLLSTLEAFLSTSVEQDVFPYRERLTIAITPSALLEKIPEIKFSEEDSNYVEVMHPSDLDFKTRAERLDFLKWLEESLVQISSRILIIRDAEAWLEQVAGQERGFARALTFGDGLTLNHSVLGEEPKIRLADWLEQDDQSYDVLRDRPWRAENSKKVNAPMEPLEPSSGPPPSELFDKERLRHTDRRILTPIDLPVWDRAQWNAILFVWSEIPDEPPILALGFKDGEAGQSIFRAWKDRWGSEDIDKMIRVAIVTGLSERNPTQYSVVIGPDFRHVATDGNKVYMFLSRTNRMTPETSENLDGFMAAYHKTGSFCLAPVWVDTSRNIVGMPSVHLAIAKRQLDIREAWQIGENDPDISALHEDDEPIIPAGIEDPPAHKALQKIRAIRERRQ